MLRAATMLLLLASSACRAEAPERPHWLVGRWSVDGRECDTSWLDYEESGTWRSPYFSGRWDYSESGLSLVATHSHMPQHYFDKERWPSKPLDVAQCHTEAVRRVGADELATNWADGSEHRLRRCPATEGPRAICVGDCTQTTPFEHPQTPAARPAAVRPCAIKS